MIDYEGFSVRIARVWGDVAELSNHEPDPRERRLPVDVADRVRRGSRAADQAVNARTRARKARNHEYESQQMTLAFDKLTDAEFELQCARELIAELEHSTSPE